MSNLAVRLDQIEADVHSAMSKALGSNDAELVDIIRVLAEQNRRLVAAVRAAEKQVASLRSPSMLTGDFASVTRSRRAAETLLEAISEPLM